MSSLTAAIAAAHQRRFELQRVLGQGGMGVVYAAYDRVRHQTVALKALQAPDGPSIVRLKHEFGVLANLDHPNLVRLHDLFVDDESCFFTMELVDGTDLATFVSPRTSVDGEDEEAPRLFDESALRHALAGLFHGLSALHAAGLVHRDLKPSNVLVTSHGRVVLIDFGLVVDSHSAIRANLKDGIAGTYAYMAPEQARGEADLTPACDLYAVGALLYELLTGHRPFEGAGLRLLHDKQTAAPPRASDRVRGLPADLDALATDCMALEPGRRPTIAAALQRIGAPRASLPPAASVLAPPAPVLVGRDPELAALDAACERARLGRRTLTLLRGRSGIGKSALLQAFSRRVAAADALVLAGRCYESGSVPFQGLDGVVDGLSVVLGGLPRAQLDAVLPGDLGELGTLFPVLRTAPPIAAACTRRHAADRSAQRTRTLGFASLRELLRRLATLRPVVLVIDDIQWADEDASRGLGALIGGDDPPPLTVVLGTRPSPASPMVREVEACEPRVLDLGPLPEDAIRRIAARDLGRSNALVDYVLRDAGGVPFAAVELARFLREGAPDAEPSASIDSLIRRRVASLSTDERYVLEAVAVAGEPVTANVALRSMQLPSTRVTGIDVLRSRGFVRNVRSPRGDRLDVTHDRIREVVLASLEPGPLSTAHRGLADALAELEVDRHDRMATHYAAAGDRVRAREHALRAAEVATQALALENAVHWYLMAVELARPSERLPSLELLAESLALAGRYVDAATTWLDAGALADGERSRELRRRAAESWLHAGRIDEGLDLLEVLASEYGVRIPEGRWAAVFELLRAQVRLTFRGTRVRRGPEAVGQLDRVRALGALALQYATLDPFRGSIAATRYLLAALDLGDDEELVTALGFGAIVRVVFGWRRGAERLLARLEQTAPPEGHPKARAWVSMARSILALYGGHRGPALRHMDTAFAAIAELPIPPPWLLGLSHYIDGFNRVLEFSPASYARVRAFVEEREERSGPCAELRLRAFTLQTHHMLVGNPEGTLAFADDARWRAATRRDMAVHAAATVYAAFAKLYVDEPQAALEVATRARERLLRLGMNRNTMARGASLWALAASAYAAGDVDRVVRCVSDMGRPVDDYARLYHRLLFAMARAAKGERDAARRALTELRALAAERDFPMFEVVACFTLGRLLPGPEGEEPRARMAAMVAGSDIVDAERFFWTRFPIGPIPPRSRAAADGADGGSVPGRG